MVRWGFTLIEVLVTLAIVAILTTLVLTALAGAREEANSFKCIGHLRQWGMALNAYANDNDGLLPRRGQGVQPVGQINRPTDWFNALPPYLGQPTYQTLMAQGKRLRPGDGCVFVCPSAKDTGGQNFLPYAMNMHLSPWSRPDPHRRQELPDPAELVFLADGPGAYASTVPSSMPYSVPALHRGRANLCFVDGHVASMDGAAIGCGKGDTHLPGVRWETLTDGINQAPIP